MKKLCELMSFPLADDVGRQPVAALSDHSQNITAGSMFFALNGTVANGRDHVAEAVANGAAYIVADGEGSSGRIQVNDGVVYIFVQDARAELASAAAKFYESDFDHMVAVTGTNGKSSTVDIMRQIWGSCRMKGASIGTLGVIFGENHERLPNNLTSPGALELHKILNRLWTAGVRNIAIEASSHGLIQRRLDGIAFDVCAFTNFTQDHLDYHGTLDGYWRAKERLFAEVAQPDAVFVVNSDDPRRREIYEIAAVRKIKCLDYGYRANDVKIIKIEQNNENQRTEASFFGKKISFVLPLQGAFQVYNSLCAAAICRVAGVEVEDIFDGLSRLRQIDGRLELIAKKKSAGIYVDYAHSPDALKSALLSLRSITKNRIITVFGCGGDRDRSKRPLMGKIAEEFSDVVIVTNDNPRTENPVQIRRMILEACATAIEIADRKDAIESAMGMLEDGDSLLVAGKGHENYQQIGNDTLHFSDREIILDGARR